MGDRSYETLCGLFSWRPDFLQPLASKKVYMFFYGVLGIIKSMQHSYLSASLSTLERKFGIKSKETAYLMCGNEIAQILFLFAMPLTVKAKKRPMWCGIGLMISAIGLYMMALPHFVTDYHFITETESVSESETANLCGSEVHHNSLEGICNEDGTRVVDWVGLVFVFLGIGLTGIGNSLFYSFGIVYLDDNAGKGNSPFWLALTFTFSLIGPTLGYLLGAKCLTTYVYPSIDPGFSEGDPRWLGAWWIGFPVIATLLLLFSAPLTLFPERLPKEGSDASKEAHEVERLTEKENDTRLDFKPAMMRLLTNKLYMWNFFSSIFIVFAFMGFGTFLPKYVEYQFRKKGSSSSVYAGSVGTGAKAIGLILSGYLIGKFKFSARALSGWNVALGICYITVLIIFSVTGCTTSQMYGDLSADGDYKVSVGCNVECGCPISRPQPVCSKDGITNFYSPCHAGCKTQLLSDTGEKSYQSCSCVEEASRDRNTSLSRHWIEKDVLREISYPALQLIEDTYRNYEGEGVSQAVPGWCEIPGCPEKFKQFMIVAFIVSVIASTGRVGNVLVALRCVEVRDKALSMAFQVVFMSLVALLPSPIIYGAIIDNTCILWQEECGETTNCLLYDTDSLRNVLMLTTAAIMSVGVLCDVAVFYYSKDLKIFYDEPIQELEDPLGDRTKRSLVSMHNNSTISLTKDSVFK